MLNNMDFGRIFSLTLYTMDFRQIYGFLLKLNSNSINYEFCPNLHPYYIHYGFLV